MIQTLSLNRRRARLARRGGPGKWAAAGESAAPGIKSLGDGGCGHQRHITRTLRVADRRPGGWTPGELRDALRRAGCVVPGWNASRALSGHADLTVKLRLLDRELWDSHKAACAKMLRRIRRAQMQKLNTNETLPGWMRMTRAAPLGGRINSGGVPWLGG